MKSVNIILYCIYKTVFIQVFENAIYDTTSFTISDINNRYAFAVICGQYDKCHHTIILGHKSENYLFAKRGFLSYTTEIREKLSIRCNITWPTHCSAELIYV